MNRSPKWHQSCSNSAAARSETPPRRSSAPRLRNVRSWLALGLLALTQCTPAMYARNRGSVRGELASGCSADFGATATANLLETFLGATADFATAAAELEESLIDACEDMADELGIPEAELRGRPDEPMLRAVCAPVAARMQAEMSDLRAEARVGVQVAATPPRCEAHLSAYADCIARCDAQIDPGQLEVQCEGGELRGYCRAECSGQCAFDVDGACSGVCEGVCSGSCGGTCNGICEGKCSATASDGSCQGRCEGTCRGSCSGGCSGGCEGQCVVSARASCDGECRGGCSVKFEEPYCTGTYRAPSASVDCNAACEAQVDARLSCKPGRVDVALGADVSSNIPERAARLRAAIEGGIPAVLRARAKLGRLASSGRVMVESIGGLPEAVAALGVGAGACAAQAISLIPRATASVSVSLEVSASLTASANVGG